jgi:hypothetical protein
VVTTDFVVGWESIGFLGANTLKTADAANTISTAVRHPEQPHPARATLEPPQFGQNLDKSLPLGNQL